MIPGLKPSDIPAATVRAAFERAIEHRCTVQIWRDLLYGTREYAWSLNPWDPNKAVRRELAGAVYYLGGS